MVEWLTGDAESALMTAYRPMDPLFWIPAISRLIVFLALLNSIINRLRSADISAISVSSSNNFIWSHASCGRLLAISVMVVDSVMIASFDEFQAIITNCCDRYGHTESNWTLPVLDSVEYTSPMKMENVLVRG